MQKNTRQQNRSDRLRNMSPEERARYEEYVKRRRAEDAKRAEEERRQAEIRERREKARREKERKEQAKIIRGRLIVFAVVFLILALAALAVFMLFFHSTPDAPKANGSIKYILGGATVRETPASDAVRTGGVYFCFNDLSDYLGMAESGSADAMKFVIPSRDGVTKSSDGIGNEEYIVFYPGGGKVNINGQEVTLDLPSYIKSDEVWVSLSFAEKYMNNLSVEYNERKSTVTLTRIVDKDLTKDSKTTVYKDVTFKLKRSETEKQIEENPLIGEVIFGKDGTYSLDFNADLDEYEEYMSPSGDKRDAFLVLVDQSKPMSEHDKPVDLIDVKYTSASRSTQQMRKYAGMALEALFKEMQSLGYYDMQVFTGYVSYSYQSTIFAQYVQGELAVNPSLTEEQAEAIVATYYPRPGTSEHQTGLSVDMDTMGAYTTDFKNTEEYKWLTENAWKFGFILRYPEDKENLTGCAFEPWHYRYVGRYHAMKMHESGLCFEEYLKEIKK